MKKEIGFILKRWNDEIISGFISFHPTEKQAKSVLKRVARGMGKPEEAYEIIKVAIEKI